MDSFRQEGSAGTGVAAAARGSIPSSGSLARTLGTGVYPDTLRGLYNRYCAAEVADLFSLVPQSALRDFLRGASEWTAKEEGISVAGDSAREDYSLSHDHALSRVRRYARSLLPLPPYERWVHSYLQNRDAYLDRLGVATAPRSEEPVMVAVQEFSEGWYAGLYLSNRDERWFGSIHFHRSEGVQSYRTTDIFREGDPEEIRARFLSFDSATLHAFLRSVLP